MERTVTRKAQSLREAGYANAEPTPTAAKLDLRLYAGYDAGPPRLNVTGEGHPLSIPLDSSAEEIGEQIQDLMLGVERRANDEQGR